MDRVAELSFHIQRIQHWGWKPKLVETVIHKVCCFEGSRLVSTSTTSSVHEAAAIKKEWEA